MHKATKIINLISVCFPGLLLVSPCTFAKDTSQTWLECNGELSFNTPDTETKKSRSVIYVFEKPNKLIIIDAVEEYISEVLPVDVSDIEIRYSAPWNNDRQSRNIYINRSTLKIQEIRAQVERFVMLYDGRCEIIKPKLLKLKKF